MFFAIIIFTGFIIADIFSSAIAISMRQEVLVQSFICGNWNYDPFDAQQLMLWYLYVTKSASSSFAYVQKCYRKNVNSRDCAIFIQSKLLWKIDRNATCFFSNKNTCLSDFDNLRLDSGYIDSDHHFDINNSSEIIFFFRIIVKCAFLRTKGYTTNTTIAYQRSGATKTDDGQTPLRDIVTKYFYGHSGVFGWNSTIQFIAKTPSSHHLAFGTANFDYSLRSVNRWYCVRSIGSECLFAALSGPPRMLIERSWNCSALSLLFLFVEQCDWCFFIYIICKWRHFFRTMRWPLICCDIYWQST